MTQSQVINLVIVIAILAIAYYFFFYKAPVSPATTTMNAPVTTGRYAYNPYFPTTVPVYEDYTTYQTDYSIPAANNSNSGIPGLTITGVQGR